jgi:hypothetical protein
MNAYKEIIIDYSDIFSKAKVLDFQKSTGDDYTLRRSIITPNIDRSRGSTLSLRKYLIFL